VEKAMRLDPRRRGDYLLTQGCALIQLGRWTETISALKSYSDSHPDVVWAHVWLAGAYGAMGDHNAAQSEGAEVERVVALNPRSAPSYNALAWVMNYTGRPREALAAVEKAMNLDQHDRVDYLFAQGVAYIGLGRWQEAIASFKPYLIRYPTDLWSHLNLAIAYSELGQDSAARAEVMEVQKLNPQFSLKMVSQYDADSEQKRHAADLLRKAGLR
jgi:tetratricopeptide (TPR) repeat protein